MPKLLRAIIVDDERLARTKIRRFLEKYGGVEVLAECANGAEALNSLSAQSADVVFLDVQMPEMDGFEMLRLLHSSGIVSESSPLVVFITAFDQYAISAFQENALDYIVKPFDYERFSAALQRVERIAAMVEDARRYHETTLEFVEQQRRTLQGQEYDTRFAFKMRGKITLIAAENVDWIEAEGNYAVFHVGAEGRYLLRETLSALEARLNPASFLRIHRSAIVHIPFLASLEQHEDGSYHAIMRDGTRWGIGPTYRDTVCRLLGL